MRQALFDEIQRLLKKHEDSNIENPEVREAWKREKVRIKILIKIASVMAYESSWAVKLVSYGKPEFERQMRAYQRIEKAFNKLTTAALKHNISALKETTVQIGDRFLTFPAWAEFNSIPFTVGDMELLKAQKTLGIMALIDALASSHLPLLIVKEYPIERGFMKFSGPTFFVRTNLAMLAAASQYAAWFDINTMRPSYANEQALRRSDCYSNTFEMPDNLFHSEPQPQDNLKITTIRVNFYRSFEQRAENFAPLLDAVYPIFILNPIPTADGVQ